MPKLAAYETGVYCWLNKVNGKRYVGKAEVGLERRRKQYVRQFLKGKCHSSYLQNAWNKYEGAITFVVLERCPKEDCLVREAYWIAYYDTTNKDNGYNICHYGLNASGAKRTDEARQRMSDAGKKRAAEQPISQKTRDKIAAAGRGRIYSAESRAKIGNALRGVPKSDEHRKKLSEASKANPLTEEQIAKKNEALGSIEIRKKLSDAHKGVPLSESHREALAAAIRRPEVRAKISKTLKLRALARRLGC